MSKGVKSSSRRRGRKYVARLLARSLAEALSMQGAARRRPGRCRRCGAGRVLGVGSVGALAIGAASLGVGAVGALAVGRLAVKRGEVASLHVGELKVENLQIEQLGRPGATERPAAHEPAGPPPPPPPH